MDGTKWTVSRLIEITWNSLEYRILKWLTTQQNTITHTRSVIKLKGPSDRRWRIRWAFDTDTSVSSISRVCDIQATTDSWMVWSNRMLSRKRVPGVCRIVNLWCSVRNILSISEGPRATLIHCRTTITITWRWGNGYYFDGWMEAKEMLCTCTGCLCLYTCTTCMLWYYNIWDKLNNNTKLISFHIDMAQQRWFWHNPCVITWNFHNLLNI